MALGSLLQGARRWVPEPHGEAPDEPLRKDYFPEEPRSSLLSEVLASVIGVGNMDGVGGDSNARRLEKIRRS